MRKTAIGPVAKRVSAFAFAAVLACSLSFPSMALASVRVNDTDLVQGDNAVGGGTASLVDTTLDMVNVVAESLFTDEDLTVNFNSGNEIEDVVVVGSADVELNYEGENAVEDVFAGENANVTINANGNNEFEEVNVFDDANVTINVTGENDFETIEGYGNSTITVQGTTCQKRDTINLGEDESTAFIATEKGDLKIDHVTVNLESEGAIIDSDEGDVTIDTSKIAKGDENEYAVIFAGGKMTLNESVIDIKGTVSSEDEMTIKHSDVKAEAPDDKYGDGPYRVYSETGVELIDEENGEVREGELYGNKVYYVDTDDGEDVDLEADGDSAYYKCANEDMISPKTGDDANPLFLMALAIASAATAAFAYRRLSVRS